MKLLSLVAGLSLAFANVPAQADPAHFPQEVGHFVGEGVSSVSFDAMWKDGVAAMKAARISPVRTCQSPRAPSWRNVTTDGCEQEWTDYKTKAALRQWPRTGKRAVCVNDSTGEERFCFGGDGVVVTEVYQGWLGRWVLADKAEALMNH